MENQQPNRPLGAQQKKTSPPQLGPPEPQWHQVILWVLIPLVLMVWNIVALWPKNHPEANIPYSVFLSQIQANNVAKVHIVGDQITGSFVKPVAWPKSQPRVYTEHKIACPAT